MIQKERTNKMKPKLTQSELRVLYDSKKFVVAFRRVYDVSITNTGVFYLRENYYYRGDMPLTKRGRFVVLEAKPLNDLIGHSIFIEDSLPA